MTKMAWIKNGWHHIYSSREIRRGKKKGKVEVEYRKGKKFRKTVIAKNAIRERGA